MSTRSSWRLDCSLFLINPATLTNTTLMRKTAQLCLFIFSHFPLIWFSCDWLCHILVVARDNITEPQRAKQGRESCCGHSGVVQRLHFCCISSRQTLIAHSTKCCGRDKHRCLPFTFSNVVFCAVANATPPLLRKMNDLIGDACFGVYILYECARSWYYHLLNVAIMYSTAEYITSDGKVCRLVYFQWTQVWAKQLWHGC